MSIKIIKSKYSSLEEWKKENPLAYKDACKQCLITRICEKFGWEIPSKYLFEFISYEDCHKEAIKYDSRTDFQKYSIKEYRIAKENGWLDLICFHMKSDLNEKFVNININTIHQKDNTIGYRHLFDQVIKINNHLGGNQGKRNDIENQKRYNKRSIMAEKLNMSQSKIQRIIHISKSKNIEHYIQLLDNGYSINQVYKIVQNEK